MPDPLTKANNGWEALNAVCPDGMGFDVYALVDADEANAAYDRQRALDGRPADPRRWRRA
jgi:hypothetical protein